MKTGLCPETLPQRPAFKFEKEMDRPLEISVSGFRYLVVNYAAERVATPSSRRQGRCRRRFSAGGGGDRWRQEQPARSQVGGRPYPVQERDIHPFTCSTEDHHNSDSM